MNANEFLRNKSVYRLDSRPSPRVRGSGFARLTSHRVRPWMLSLCNCVKPYEKIVVRHKIVSVRA